MDGAAKSLGFNLKLESKVHSRITVAPHNHDCVDASWLQFLNKTLDQWFITADPALENVAILTRMPNPPRAEIDALTERVRQLGYDPAKLEFPTLFPPDR